MRIPLLTSLLDFLHGNRLIIFNTREVVRMLSVKIGDRSSFEYENLQLARYYVLQKFKEYGASPVEETYDHNGREFSNIVVELPGIRKGGFEDIIIIGAHYDTVEGSRGANDNASGVSALLELYRILSRYKMKRTVRLVAFTLEEPPHFNSKEMGSAVYASLCLKNKDRISLMICLDMIGFAGLFVKQEYPVEEMKDRYPVTGDFLAVAALPSYAQYAFLFKKIFNKSASGKIHDIVAPASIDGVNLSDHMSFHKCGIPAILISDTGHYRNKNYHTENDTENTINYWFLAHNILHIAQTIREITSRRSLP